MSPNTVLNLPQSPGMVDVLRQGLTTSDEAAICVSFLRFSGLSLLLKELKTFLDKNGKLKLLTSTYLDVTQPEALEVLMKLQNVELRLQDGVTGFHTKFYSFNSHEYSEHCWIGSSNLTKGGISSNIEWNLKHSHPDIIRECRDNFNVLWNRDDVFPLTQQVLETYRNRYKESKENSVSIHSSISSDNPSDRYIPNAAQDEALKELDKLRGSGEKRAVVIAATGIGKTFLAAFDSKAFKANSLLFIAHREELLTQAEATFKKIFGSEADTGILAGGKNPGKANFIFATIQSLSQVNNQSFVDRDYDYIVIDEFHHAAAPSYRKILNRIQPKFLLGVTATPERQDGHDVLEICQYNIAYEVRLPEAINRNWLVPFHYFGVADELIDYENIKWRSGKFDPTELENALILEERVDDILKHALEKGFDGRQRATVGFCAGVRHAEFMADALIRRGFESKAVTGKTSPDERQRVYERFSNPHDPLEWLFVSDLLNEGVDIPEINSILFLRPTESSTLFLQQLGRGLRLYPDTEILTIIDFIGHHKNAWLSLQALKDPHSTLGSRTEDLGISPPKHCEIILEDRTKEILLKIKNLSKTKAATCKEAYDRLKLELGYPPKPIDFVIREDMPSMKELRQVFGSWLDCRIAMNDATDWEIQIRSNELICNFLKSVELDWQAQRVIPYALLWATCHYPSDRDEGYNAFFNKYPYWAVEKPGDGSYGKAFTTLEKKLPKVFSNGEFISAIQNELKANRKLAENVEDRILYTLHNDYHSRHRGVLRDPKNLTLYARYERSEIINYFGVQYDPAKHNSGVIKLLDNNIILIVKIDTGGAKKEFQYQNRFLDKQHFSWQSQNKQRQDNKAGRDITEHQELNNVLHLFIQPGSHQEAYYMGIPHVSGVSGNAPMTITFELSQAVPDSVFKALTLLIN
jgi:superfamily II DNA or RNA helicase/HKD family nuclease